VYTTEDFLSKVLVEGEGRRVFAVVLALPGTDRVEKELRGEIIREGTLGMEEKLNIDEESPSSLRENSRREPTGEVNGEISGEVNGGEPTGLIVVSYVVLAVAAVVVVADVAVVCSERGADEVELLRPFPL
jgi:hypothetical protein